jgi:hypothetical protein
MSGPNPPGPESEELEPGVEPSHSGGEFDGGDSNLGAGAGESDAEGQTGQTDVYSRAYSAPESEHISSGPYVPANLDLYDYDSYDDAAPDEAEASTARWPWIVGIAAIVAAIALVVSVSLLFARTDSTKLATPSTAPTSTPPMQDEIIVTTTPPAPPPSSSEAPPPPPPPSSEAPPPPPRPRPRRPHRPQRRLRPPRPRRPRRRPRRHPPGPSSTRIR